MSGGSRKRTRIKGLWVTEGGHYHARLRDKTTGKPKWVPLGTDYDEAKKKLYEFKAGAPIPSRVTLAEAVAGWLDKRTLKAWRAEGAEKAPKLSPLTVMHILSDFRALLRWAEITGRLDRSPFVSRLIMPRIAEKAPKGLSPAEIAKLTSLPGDYGWTWRFMIGSGLRWGEATRARADHVQDGVLLVEKAKGKRVRRVPLTDDVIAEVRGRVGLLVPFVSPGSFARTSRKLTGLKDVHPHQCRHTFAMAWVAEGGSLAALQEVLGHKDLKTTMVYARVTDDLVKREAARVYAQKNRVPGTSSAPEKEHQEGA